jgi:hypothetical protein
MRFKRSVMSVASIVSQIERDQLNLQPNFQRGEIWPDARKQSLVDSILRNWYVPPVHVVQVKDGSRDVLDGKQRLTAIFEFVHGAIAVDGSTQPLNRNIQRLDGLIYAELPRRVRRRFDNFKITVFTLDDYDAAEPGELFFRLNQPATLTAAEKRNAFYGSARDQVKAWVDLLASGGVDEKVLGFSNIRMAYDDTLARVALTVEHGTLAHKVTAAELVEVYRSSKGFSKPTDRTLQNAIRVFASGAPHFKGDLHFNKATVYSWFVFIARALERLDRRSAFEQLPGVFGDFVTQFSIATSTIFADSTQESLWQDRVDRQLLLFYQGRATSRVADVSSVVIRDLITWLCFADYLRASESRVAEQLSRDLRTALNKVEQILGTLKRRPLTEEMIEECAQAARWEQLR